MSRIWLPHPQACFVVHGLDPKQRFVACGSEDHHVFLWGLSSKEVGGAGPAIQRAAEGAAGRAAGSAHAVGMHARAPPCCATPPASRPPALPSPHARWCRLWACCAVGPLLLPQAPATATWCCRWTPPWPPTCPSWPAVRTRGTAQSAYGRMRAGWPARREQEGWRRWTRHDELVLLLWMLSLHWVEPTFCNHSRHQLSPF